MLLEMKNVNLGKYSGKSRVKQNGRVLINYLITKIAVVVAYLIIGKMRSPGSKYFNSHLVWKTRRNNNEVYLFEQKDVNAKHILFDIKSR